MRAAFAFGIVTWTAAALGGCAGTDASKALTSALKSDGKATATTVIPLGTSPSVHGSPTAVYERVARGVLTCWFGGLGPLTKSHIFNADAVPPSQGGGAEITIHERDTNPLPNQSPRGARAFRIWFERESEESTRMRLESARLPADLKAAMERDAVAWAVDKVSCEAQVARPPPPPPPAPEKTKVKKRSPASAPQR